MALSATLILTVFTGGVLLWLVQLWAMSPLDAVYLFASESSMWDSVTYTVLVAVAVLGLIVLAIIERSRRHEAGMKNMWPQAKPRRRRFRCADSCLLCNNLCCCWLGEWYAAGQVD